MSEFQYYEFYSIDRELSSKERREVDELSSRFSPTSRRAVFSYSYSDFRYDVEKVLIKYFDFFLYLSNWGTKRLMYKLPKSLVDYKALKQYECEFDDYEGDNRIRIYKKSKFVLIDINFSESGEGVWIEDENYWSSELINLRQDLLEGDYRSLFMVWLHMKNLEFSTEQIGIEFEIAKKIIPANLANLNSGLESLMSLFGINRDWISGASVYSDKSEPNEIDYKAKIKELPVKEKDEYLLRLLRGEDNLRIKLKKEIDNQFSEKYKQETSSDKITLEELLASVKKEEEKRENVEAKHANKERLNKLKQTEKNKEAITRKIHYHIEKGSGKSYDEAFQRIVDLKELSEYKKEEEKFKKWIIRLKKAIPGKRAMLKRLELIEL